MTAKPRKPLLVNLTWVGVLVVALPTVYIGSFGFACWLDGRGVANFEYSERHGNAVFEPIWWWAMHEHPGAKRLVVFSDWCYWHGVGDPKSWDELCDVYDHDQ